MQLEIKINNSVESKAHYITWTPANCQIRIIDPAGATDSLNIRLVSKEVSLVIEGEELTSTGKIVFYQDIPEGLESPNQELQFNLPTDGTPIDFYVAGDYPHASTGGQDVAIEVVDANDTVLSSTPLMVRIRKNANELIDIEQSIYIDALHELLTSGKFKLFRDIHQSGNAMSIWNEIHNNISFLVWHRAFILHYERELQQINPNVALPYWRFDDDSPRVFTGKFMGRTTRNNLTPVFDQGNKLSFWQVDGSNIQRQRQDLLTRIISQNETLNLGRDFRNFSTLEGNPHGTAHNSMGGWLASLNSSWDPLFYMLHCNVDRLWAKWQWLNNRFDLTDTATYPNLGSSTPGDTGVDTRFGRNLQDTLWPWDGNRNDHLATVTPSNGFPPSSLNLPPASKPLLEDMIDYAGKVDPARYLGFDYDDIYEFSE